MKFKVKDRLEKFGITKSEYEAMKAAQGNRCFICKENKTLCIDHNHSTGQIRRLLCHTCNLGIGVFYDNPDLLREAADYLELFGEPVAQVSSPHSAHHL